ncbi:hypothetical protein [Clostridium beijerinckii]|uniref:hypothetical protein n=1 Tax=Clostridium beijerinckii TaxID=1520 RepID=UPI00047C71EF|nr:hypothetical protein [Clostridium beijerinckii]
MNEIIVRILKSKITRDKANNTLKVDETTARIKIFLAGGDITAEQYGEFVEMITPVTEDNKLNTESTAS